MENVTILASLSKNNNIISKALPAEGGLLMCKAVNKENTVHDQGRRGEVIHYTTCDAGKNMRQECSEDERGE